MVSSKSAEDCLEEAPHPAALAADNRPLIAEEASMALLEVDAVSKYFGSLVALHKVGVRVEEGSIHAVIGPNGAGKTTLFNTITGVLEPEEGAISFKGHRIKRLHPHQRAVLGICRTFQTVRVFPQMTVLENVMVGR